MNDADDVYARVYAGCAATIDRVILLANDRRIVRHHLYPVGAVRQHVGIARLGAEVEHHGW